mgnify:FL=1
MDWYVSCLIFNGTTSPRVKRRLNRMTKREMAFCNYEAKNIKQGFY